MWVRVGLGSGVWVELEDGEVFPNTAVIYSETLGGRRTLVTKQI